MHNLRERREIGKERKERDGGRKKGEVERNALRRPKGSREHTTPT